MFPTGMNVLEHFGPIKEAACLFKRDIQLARLFEKIAKKRRKRKEKYRFQSVEQMYLAGWLAGLHGSGGLWFTANQVFSTVSVVIFCSSFGN